MTALPSADDYLTVEQILLDVARRHTSDLAAEMQHALAKLQGRDVSRHPRRTRESKIGIASGTYAIVEFPPIKVEDARARSS